MTATSPNTYVEMPFDYDADGFVAKCPRCGKENHLDQVAEVWEQKLAFGKKIGCEHFADVFETSEVALAGFIPTPIAKVEVLSDEFFAGLRSLNY